VRIDWIGLTRAQFWHIWRKHKIDENELQEAFAWSDTNRLYRRGGQARYTQYSQTGAGRYIFGVIEIGYKDPPPGMRIYELHDSSDIDPGDMGRKRKGGVIVTARDMDDAE